MGIVVKKLLRQCRKDKYILCFFILSLFFSLSSYAKKTNLTMPLFKHALPEATLKQYPVLPYNFLDLIKVIPKPLPVTLNKFTKIFNNQLRINEKDEDSVSYTLGSYRTLDGVILRDVGVLTSLKVKWKVVGLDLKLDQQQCVRSNILKKEFGFFIPELLTFHPEPNAPIAIHTADEWGVFIMGITVDYPDCAKNIGIGMFVNDKERQEWIKLVRKQAASLRERGIKNALGSK